MKRTLKRTTFFTLHTALGIGFLLAACGGSGTGLCANDYFPVVEGATWTYHSAGGPAGDSSWVSTVSDVASDGFTLNNQFDELTATQQWSCLPDGLRALEYGGGPEASLTTSSLTGTMETTDISGVSFPRTINAGDTWEQTYTIHGEITIEGGLTATADGAVTQSFNAVGVEPVTVPAGSFDAMKLQVNIHFDLQLTMGEGVVVPMEFDAAGFNWLAPNVGWVKSETTSGLLAGVAHVTTTELQSYSIP